MTSNHRHGTTGKYALAGDIDKAITALTARTSALEARCAAIEKDAAVTKALLLAATGGGSFNPPAPEPPPDPEEPTFTAVGFGKNALWSTARTDYHVTDGGNGTGTGTLRAALSASNRNIIFDVATVTIDGEIAVASKSNIVIDGSTYASGVEISGDSLEFTGCDHIVIRNIAFRACDNPDNGAIQLRSTCHDILIDRCSFSGWKWRGVDVYQYAYNVTVQWCFFGGYTNYGAGSYDYPLYAYLSDRVSVDHCLFYGSVYRQPQASIDAAPSYVTVDIANCLMWSEDASYYSFVGSQDQSWVNCRQSWFHSTVNTGDNHALHTESGGYIYSSGNYGDGVSLVTANPAGSPYSTTGYGLPLETTAEAAAAAVLANAGRYPRDATDTAFAAEITL